MQPPREDTRNSIIGGGKSKGRGLEVGSRLTCSRKCEKRVFLGRPERWDEK